jgi:hypothetical protein
MHRKMHVRFGGGPSEKCWCQLSMTNSGNSGSLSLQHYYVLEYSRSAGLYQINRNSRHLRMKRKVGACCKSEGPVEFGARKTPQRKVGNVGVLD